MFSSLIQRMILGELIKVFLLSLVALTGLLLLAGIFSEASRNGLTPAQILAIIPLLIPSTLPYTLPTTTLFATCVVYGRLAHDNEILALKAAGINILYAVWPAILLGIGISLITIGLYYRAIPYTHFLLRTRFLNDIEELLYSMLRRDGRINHPKLSYEIEVHRVQGRKLFDAIFKRRTVNGHGYDLIARASEAELRVDLANNKINVHMRFCRVTGSEGDHSFFENKVWPVEIPPDFAKPEKVHTNDMTWREMLRHRKDLKGKIGAIEVDIAAHKAQLALGTAPNNFAQHVRDQENKKKQKNQELRDIVAEMNQRPALSLGCLCFVLVGCPVGIWFSRSDYLSAFITCFLPIVVVYYPLMLCSINLARSGQLSPYLAIWFADTLMVLCSLALYRRLLRH